MYGRKLERQLKRRHKLANYLEKVALEVKSKALRHALIAAVNSTRHAIRLQYNYATLKRKDSDDFIFRRMVTKTCLRKIRYSTLEEAQKAANELDNIPYWCNFCGEYHLTNVGKKESAERIEFIKRFRK